MKGYCRNEVPAREGIDTAKRVSRPNNASMVEMRYQPERALTQVIILRATPAGISVEMRYQPERALTHHTIQIHHKYKKL